MDPSTFVKLDGHLRGSSVTAFYVLSHPVQQLAAPLPVHPVPLCVHRTAVRVRAPVHIGGLSRLRVIKDASHVVIDRLPYWTLLRYYVPGRCLAGPVVAHERVQGGGAIVAVADAEEEPGEALITDGGYHRIDVVPAGAGKPELMVRVPFADVHQPETVPELGPHGEEVVDVLVEERRLVVSIGAGPDREEDHRGPVLGPVSEQLTSRLDVRAVQNAARDVIHLAAEDYGPFRPGGRPGGHITGSPARRGVGARFQSAKELDAETHHSQLSFLVLVLHGECVRWPLSFC